MTTTGPALTKLVDRIGALTVTDAHRLGRRLEKLQRIRDPKRRGRDADALDRAIGAAEERVARRAAAVPDICYPQALPVSARREDIAAAITDHQVVVLAGETGSGKTTQLPKICLGLGRGVRGMIGHTQPRRLAARTVAERIASELHTTVGGAVGYAVRFTDTVGEDTLVKLMTDGILLAEVHRDPLLRAYDTIIVDEAHERSLNIDFLLGILTQLLPRRPDLKMIITSATIDPDRFAAHFGGAPVVEVSGRTYPVEVRYRPLIESADMPDDDTAEVALDTVRDQTEAVVDAVAELRKEAPGDVLVFLSGEREIRDTAEALAAQRFPDTEILPLYARLSAAEQHRVFAPHSGNRVVLATNVAETSLTVPGVRYVVDTGTARISRYSHRTKVQRLPIEPISQASANQRAGRCGRVADGICIRLYSEADFAGRPEFTEPEIVRTNLASVVLQLAALELGDIADFPFVDPPERRSIADATLLLTELGAIVDGRLTEVGRMLARLPVDPRLARMIVAAGEQGCVREILVLAAVLSIPDPRERPVEHRDAAAGKHARFADRHSDFSSYLNLWTYLREQQRTRSGNSFRRMCRDEFLHYLRIREWQDLVGQLRQAARSLGLGESTEPAGEDAVHSALLAGLLSHIGVRDGDGREYLGARGSRFVIAPGSALTRKPPRWVVAAELVETSRLYARIAARIDPDRIERAAGQLVSRSYSEPHWDAERGATVGYERVSLYGLPLIARRRVDYGKIDPALAREEFIRHALVEEDWRTHHAFAAHNSALREQLAGLSDRARRDVFVDDEVLVAFFDQRIPPDIVSAADFDRWWKSRRKREPNLLDFSPELLIALDAPAVDDDRYPLRWSSDGADLPLSYRFDPGSAQDGVTVAVPLDVLSRLGGETFAWQVPALREEVLVALLRSLPKGLRRALGPAPDRAADLLAALGDDVPPGGVLDAMSAVLARQTGVEVPRDAWRPDALPEHLRLTFAVTDEHGARLASGKDLAALRRRLAVPVQQAAASIAPALERDGLARWDFGELPRVVRAVRDGRDAVGYPALLDSGSSVSIRVLASAGEQARAMPRGTRRLLRLTTPVPRIAAPSLRQRLLAAVNLDGGSAELSDDIADAAVDDVLARHGGPAWDAAGFQRLQAATRAELPGLAAELSAEALRALTAYAELVAAIPDPVPTGWADAVSDVRAQLAALLPAGFVTATGRDRMPDLTRYLSAAAYRIARLPGGLDADRGRMTRVHAVVAAYADLARRWPPGTPVDPGLVQLRWMIEELRVSLFAQQLGTRVPVSEQRIYRALDALDPDLAPVR